MRIEREHNSFAAYFARALNQSFYDSRMPQMDAIEIANRNRAAAKCVRNFR
jgi:hypothetical protein